MAASHCYSRDDGLILCDTQKVSTALNLIVFVLV
jgi:hypothetical protein